MQINAYKIWLDLFSFCPYERYDWTRKSVYEATQLIKNHPNTYFYISCQTKAQQQALLDWAEENGVSEFVKTALH